MITKKAWLGVLLGFGVAPAVLLCTVNGFVPPGLDDVVDPPSVDRPSSVSK